MKVIRPHGIMRIIMISVYVLCFGCSGITLTVVEILEIIDRNYSVQTIEGLVLGIVSSVFTVLLLIKLLRNKLFLSDEDIVVTGDGRKNNFFIIVIQYPVTIRYDEISELSFVIRTQNTRGKHVRGRISPTLNLVVTCKNRRKKIINLYTFSRKQRYFLLDWIIAKVKETQGLVLTEMTGEEFYKDFIRKDKERALSRRKK